MTDVLDIFIIGGGPIGLACGIEAKQAGLKYLIVEKGTLVNSLYNYPLNMTFCSDESIDKRCFILLYCGMNEQKVQQATCSGYWRLS